MCNMVCGVYSVDGESVVLSPILACDNEIIVNPAVSKLAEFENFESALAWLAVWLGGLGLENQ